MRDLNTQLFFFFNNFAGQSAYSDFAIIFFANYLAYILVAVFIIGLIIWKVPRPVKIRAGLEALVAGVVARGFIVETIRFFYHHPRPFVTITGVFQLFSESSYSFPSGHATFFFALSAVVYHHNKKAGIAFFTLSAIMGLARISAGVHYPLDILGGAVIGWLVGMGTCALMEKFSRKNSQ